MTAFEEEMAFEEMRDEVRAWIREQGIQRHPFVIAALLTSATSGYLLYMDSKSPLLSVSFAGWARKMIHAWLEHLAAHKSPRTDGYNQVMKILLTPAMRSPTSVPTTELLAVVAELQEWAEARMREGAAPRTLVAAFMSAACSGLASTTTYTEDELVELALNMLHTATVAQQTPIGRA